MQDTVNLAYGFIPGGIVCLIAQLLHAHTASWLVAGCIVDPGEGQRCQLQAQGLTIAYIIFLVFAAELGQRFGLYILPTGAKDSATDGKKVIDFQRDVVPQVGPGAAASKLAEENTAGATAKGSSDAEQPPGFQKFNF